MSKFVIFDNDEGYQKCTIKAALEDEDVIVANSISSGFKKKVFEMHNAWSLNKRKEMPLKQVWFKQIFDESLVPYDEEVYFLFYESCYMSYSKTFLRYLRKKYANSKFSFLFTNPCGEYNLVRTAAFKNYYDVFITFFIEDADKYGFLFCDCQPYKLPEVDKDIFSHSDVFFVGADKGRLEKLIGIYEKLTTAGLKCDFHIVGVEDQRQKYSENIIYNKRMSYEEVLQRVNSSSCILEVLQDGHSYISLRAIEAMQYHRKLMTTSKATMGKDFYNPQIIQIIDDVSNIDIGFFKNNADDNLFPGRELWSFALFKKFLMGCI